MFLKRMVFLIVIMQFGILFAQTTFDAIRIRSGTLGFGARTLAMGGNGVASAEDYSALYWNPAGLAALRQNQFSGELSHLQFNNKASFQGDYTDMSDNFTRLRSLGLAIPLPTTRGSLVLALGYNFVQDFDEYLFFNGFNRNSNGLQFELENPNGVYQWYDFDKDVDQSEELSIGGGIHQWSVGGAIALSPNLDAGIALNFWRGKEDYYLQFKQEDSENLYADYPADFFSYTLNQNLITRYNAFSLKLGGIFKLNEAMQMGMAIEFPTTFTVKEEYSSSDELVFDDGFVDAVDYEPGEWEYEVKTPYRFDAGIGIQSEYIKLTAGGTYQDWTQTKFQAPEYAALDEDYSQLLEENRFFRSDFRATIDYHLGGELRSPENNIFLRAGYAVHPSPYKDATSEMAKTYYTGGIGFKVGTNAYLDITYVRGNWKRESEDIYTPGGTLEKITENRVFLGIRYNF
ncbi:MAG: hypothetical protein Kow0042_12750 [Calditrichia bacterium]